MIRRQWLGGHGRSGTLASASTGIAHGSVSHNHAVRIDRHHVMTTDEQLPNTRYEMREESVRPHTVLHHDAALAIEHKPNELPNASAARTLDTNADDLIISQLHTRESR